MVVCLASSAKIELSARSCLITCVNFRLDYSPSVTYYFLMSDRRNGGIGVISGNSSQNFYSCLNEVKQWPT